MPIRFLPVLILLSLLATPQEAAGAGPASLVLDINSTGQPGNDDVGVSGRFLPMGDKVLFPAFEASSGNEIWVSDGTPEGTRLVRDLCPGPCSFSLGLLRAAGSFGLFWVDRNGSFPDPVELWRTDGTTAGTFRISNADATGCFGVENTPGASLGGLVLFSLSTPEAGCELWRTDGTVAGTVPVKDLVAGPDDSSPQQFVVAGGKLFFFAKGPLGLWRSDGTAAGTTLVRSFPVNTQLRRTVAVGSRVFFINSLNGDEQLWTSDGTPAGTEQLAVFDELNLRLFHGFDGVLYFLADDGGGDEIWRSNGTVASTAEVTDFGQSDPFGFDFQASEIVKLGNRLVFVTDDGSDRRLWTSGGTPGTTVPLAGCPEGCPAVYAFPFEGSPFVEIGGDRAVFAGEDERGVELWITDGTGAGTRMIRDLCPDPQECSSYPHGLFGALGKAFFSGQNPGSFGHWATDGTAEGTVHLADVAPDATGELLEIPPVTVGGRVFYVAKNESHDAQLWVSDGTPAGTRLVGAISDSAPGSFPSELVPAGSEVRFVACDGEMRTVWQSGGTAASTSALGAASVHCSFDNALEDLTVSGGLTFFLRKDPSESVYRLWRTDGTDAGTLQLSPSGVTGAGAPVVFGGRVVFLVADTSGGSAALWESNGSPAGTRKLFDLPADVLFPDDLTVLGPELYFVAQTGTSRDHQLWRSDGTKAGTRQVTDFETAFFFRAPLQLARTAGTVFFVASVRSLGGELWKTNGTLASTALVLPPTFDAAGKDASNLVAFQGEVYFTAHVSSADLRHGLWKSNGTAAGTKLLQAIGAEAQENPWYTELGDRLYFVADDQEHGLELWRTDGTAAGTVLVRDIAPGRSSSRPSWLAAAGSLLYFAAGEDEHGIELWRSDGTPEGTWMAEDIAPDALSSSPEELTVAGDRLFFSADDGISGRELWTYSLVAGPSICKPSAEALCLNGGRFRVEIAWRDFAGQAGKGHAVPLTSDSGYFWFFDEANVEVILKVLDGRGVNGHHWVFYGALSSVEYTITVTDSQTGAVRQYSNPSGRLASAADTKAFATGEAGAASATEPAAVTAVRAPAAASVCEATATRLCLNGGRFMVEATWRDFQGNQGVGKALPLSGDTGGFWFFNQENVEVVLKVLDGRPVNGKFWVFYGALSSVEYTLTVTDTQTGAIKVYKNPSGLLASVADTSAF